MHRTIACLLLALLTTAAAAEETSREWWYRIELDEAPAGWMMERETRESGRLIIETETELKLKRGPSTQILRTGSRFVESEDGEPLEASQRREFGGAPVESHFKFTEAGIEAVYRQGTQERRERLPHAEGEWLAPGQTQAEIARQVTAGAEAFRIRTIEPEASLQPFEELWTRVAAAVPRTLGDTTVETSHWKVEQAIQPGVVIDVYLDDKARLAELLMPVLGLQMRAVRTTRELARAESEAPEVFLSTLVKTERPIPKPRATQRVEFRLRAPDDAILNLPSVGYQIATTEEGSVHVVVDLTMEPSQRLPEEERESLLEESTLVDHGNEAVRALLTTALDGASKDPGERAARMHAAVSRHVRDKNLDSLLASAGEVASSGSGDCTEHAVLLAALLRADGIPARVAMGLIYAERIGTERQVLGYHMWTQALLDDRWVDLDATLDQSFDASHITLLTSALDDASEPLLGLGSIATLMGRLEVEVLESSIAPEEDAEQN